MIEPSAAAVLGPFYEAFDMILTHIVKENEAALPLSAILRRAMGLSARQVRESRRAGGITVDGAYRYPNQPVPAGSTVRVALTGYAEGESAPTADAGKTTSLRVLFEDDTLIAVYKPALLQCHPSPSAPRGSDTMQARVYAYLHVPAHPIHRLDAETKGILLFAKLPYAQAHLQQQMQQGTFCKTYEALAFGAPPAREGEIDAPIARISEDSFTRCVRADGQSAVSRYRVLNSLVLADGARISHLSLSPITGRTHQLRVHMAHIGCPLLGDTRYFTLASRACSEQLGLSCHQLSAVSLSFVHPITGDPMRIACPPTFSIPFPSLSEDAHPSQIFP